MEKLIGGLPLIFTTFNAFLAYEVRMPYAHLTVATATLNRKLEDPVSFVGLLSLIRSPRC